MSVTQIISPKKSTDMQDGYSLKSLHELHEFLKKFSEQSIYLAVETTKNLEASVEAPKHLISILKNITEILADGDGVAIASVEEQLTTQEAADILNVSRQYLVRLLNEGKIPFTKAGTHRRVLMKNVLAFKTQRDQKRRATLQELTQLSEAYQGYPERDATE